MPHRVIGLLLCGGALLLSSPASASAVTVVTVRVEGASRTLVERSTVTLGGSPVVKDGNRAHSCAGSSAAGALEAATAGGWAGIWSDPLGYLVTAIRGEALGRSERLSLWVDHRRSRRSLCATTLTPGADVLLSVERCDRPDEATGGCRGARAPLAISSPRRVRRGRTVTVRVVSYGPTGRASAEPGASVFANGRRYGRADRRGRLRLRAAKAGLVRFSARKSGRVRSAIVITRITRR